MSYIYHLKPDPMEGSELIPLNMMCPESDLYKKHASKYVGRESLMKEMIPILDCKWNDVVQFSALDPQIIVDELKSFHSGLKLLRLQYYKIHVDDIIGNFDSIVFDRSQARKKKDFTIQDSEVEVLNKSYRELTEVPDATIKCWKKAKEEGGKLLWFPFIPHILIKGRIETSKFEICNLSL